MIYILERSAANVKAWDPQRRALVSAVCARDAAPFAAPVIRNVVLVNTMGIMCTYLQFLDDGCSIKASAGNQLPPWDAWMLMLPAVGSEAAHSMELAQVMEPGTHSAAATAFKMMTVADSNASTVMFEQQINDILPPDTVRMWGPGAFQAAIVSSLVLNGTQALLELSEGKDETHPRLKVGFRE